MNPSLRGVMNPSLRGVMNPSLRGIYIYIYILRGIMKTECVDNRLEGGRGTAGNV